ncbi:MAG: formimidoylglutamate deiminase [Devosia sp.]|nr:formimidoylglutamate deiminase [Devosia sp.]
MLELWAEQALVEGAWQRDVALTIADSGRIGAVAVGASPRGMRVGALLAAPANLHSHAFQRAMAGMAERRGPTGRDSFWTWRRLMFRFLEALNPEDIEVIAAFVQMQMLEAGYAAVGEFHYLHHQPDGSPYADPGELSGRMVEAARQSGIGLTLLPVLYQQAGCDGAALAPGQVRFGNTVDRYAALLDRTARSVATLPADAGVGVAPHSLRAVSRDGLAATIRLAAGRPLHMHVAEQTAEVEEVLAAYGQRPIEWLLDHCPVDTNWCLIHATHMTESETMRLARTGAVAGLCPITEANLGDGIFNGVAYGDNGGRFGIGSDSNIRIALAEELRTLEYSQRLRDRGRALLATPTASTGRVLLEQAARGGAQALGRDAGSITAGRWVL